MLWLVPRGSLELYGRDKHRKAEEVSKEEREYPSHPCSKFRARLGRAAIGTLTL